MGFTLLVCDCVLIFTYGYCNNMKYKHIKFLIHALTRLTSLDGRVEQRTKCLKGWECSQIGEYLQYEA